MSEFTSLHLEQTAPGVTTLWLDREARHNAFDAQMIEELLSALAQLKNDPALRVLVLRGRGRHFCAGADLAWMQQGAALPYDANLRDAERLGQLMQALHGFPTPTLAVVQGAAFGGGLGLVACCDMAIGSTSAQFCLSEVRIGLVPAVISPYVAQAIGHRALRRYGLTAERFDGEQACALGLLAECFSNDELDAAVERWLANLLLNSPAAMVQTKALLLEVSTALLDEHLRARTAKCIAEVRVSAQAQEGLQAFLEKRSPGWI
ncbi:enoyl-CoA hydratase-related protein [Pseudomonas sp. dw_358]|uniref:enoyl-CoA hydratase-related protein n=1 Tax=Pseudomonas sp. dw_358 TaxID=2720083 RepID=UPI001BD63064|nr:enoyl-CoA hydratase-related protein [Pseudomonas sp. dw_358]